MSTLTKPPINPHLADDIAALVSLGERARFKDFARLRSGYDQWSDLGLVELRRRAGDDVAEAVSTALPNVSDQAKALRWHLRGLPGAMAVRKVKTDAEVSENAERVGKGALSL